MEFELLGWPADGETLRLDYRRFSYAGKFVMSNTGKAVARDGDELVAAVAFNEDRTDPDAAWLRYVTVREDRRGEGIGSALARFTTDRLREAGYDRVRIAVNNPFAYHALHKAGFGFTGEETGIAELVLEHPAPALAPASAPASTSGDGDARCDESDAARADRYRAGLERYRGRENLDSEERSFLASKVETGPPPVADAVDASSAEFADADRDDEQE